MTDILQSMFSDPTGIHLEISNNKRDLKKLQVFGNLTVSF